MNIRKGIILLPVLPLLVYYSGIFFLAQYLKVPLSEVVVFHPSRSDPLWIGMLKIPVAISAYFMILLLPGIVWTLLWYKPASQSRIAFLSLSAGVSIGILIAATMLYKAFTGAPICRLTLFLIISGITFLGWIFLIQDKGLDEKCKRILSIKTEDTVVLCCMLFFVVALIVIFREKIFIENFNGDGAETFLCAEHFKSSNFFHGEIEGLHGKVAPVFKDTYYVNTCLAMFSLVLLGSSEAPVRLLYFVYLLGIYLLLLSRAFIGDNRITAAVLSMFSLLQYTMLLFFYGGYNPYFVDIASPPMVDTLLAAFILLQVYALLTHHHGLFLLSAAFSLLTRFFAPVFTYSVLLAYFVHCKKERRLLLRLGLRYSLIVLILMFLYISYGWKEGVLDVWLYSVYREFGAKYFTPNNISYVLIFIKYFLLATLLVPSFCIPLCLLAGRDRFSKVLATVTVLSLAIILSSGYKNIHYFSLLMVFPPIIFFRWSGAASHRLVKVSANVVFCVVAAVIIRATVPRMYPVHTEYRSFGRKTCMLLADFDKAVIASEIIHSLKEKDIWDWEFSKCAWLAYSDDTLFPAKGYYYLLMDMGVCKKDARPPGTVIAREGAIVLYARKPSAFLMFKAIRPPRVEDIYSTLYKELL